MKKKLLLLLAIVMVAMAAGACATSEPVTEFSTEYFTVTLPEGEWHALMREPQSAIFESQEGGSLGSVRVDALELELGHSSYEEQRDFFYDTERLIMASKSVDGHIIYEDATIAGLPAKTFYLYIPFNDQEVPLAANFLIVDGHLLNVTYYNGNMTLEQMRPVMEEINAGIKYRPGEKTSDSENTIESYLIADDESFRIEISDLSLLEDRLMFNIRMKNRTDTKMSCSLDHVVINGYETNVLWSKQMEADEEITEEVGIWGLESLGINGAASEIRIKIKAYESGHWTTSEDVIYNYTIYPSGKEAVNIRERESQPGDTVIADTDEITIIATGIEYNRIFGFGLKCYFVNKSDVEISSTVSEALLNGKKIDAYWAVQLLPHSRRYDTVYWSDRQLQENELEKKEISNINLTFRVHDVDHWSNAEYYQGMVLIDQ